MTDQSVYDSLPLPLTTINLRPRSETRRSKSSSQFRSSASGSVMSTASGEGSSRGVKRPNAKAEGSRKRQKVKAKAESEDGSDSGLVDELPDNLTPKTPPLRKKEEIEEPILVTSASKKKAKPADDSKSGASTEPIIISGSSIASSSKTKLPSPKTPHLPAPPGQPLSAYTCPICFCAPTNATLTPCGHVCCGSCLFTAIKTMMQRGTMMMPGFVEARCPVCRAEIPGWDGKGGGVIGLQTRCVVSV
ncbi:hypothetical protein C8F01DRAFT_34604 [Mycena amicta]|nr:hypothetical protein C8F01DRAFT_34604 [Mycena amicta]